MLAGAGAVLGGDCQGRPSCGSRLPSAACRPTGPLPFPPVLPPWEGTPGLSARSRHSFSPPSHRARAAAAAGAAETITGGGSCGGAGNGPGGAGRRVPPGSSRATVEEWSAQRRADGGVRNEGGSVGSGRGRGARAPLGRDRLGRGVGASGTIRRTRAGTAGAARGRRMDGLEAGRSADED